MAKYKTVWFLDSGQLISESFKYVLSFFDDSHPKPSVVTGQKQSNHSTCASFTYLGENDFPTIAIVDDVHADKPDMWFVYVENDNAMPPLRSLVAFADNKFADGTILSPQQAEDNKINKTDSCAFISWVSHRNIMQQITVREQFRRQGISGKLIAVADTLIVADVNWSGNFLTGGLVTTEDGEKLRTAWNASGSKRVLNRMGSVGHQ